MEPEDSLPSPETPQILTCLKLFEFDPRNNWFIFDIFFPFLSVSAEWQIHFENFRPIYSVGSSFPYAICISRQFHER
jgi:hypothetical protein